MNELQKILNWGEDEFKKLFEELPTVVKEYEQYGISVCNTIKAALSSPEGQVIESALAGIIGSTWEGKIISGITKALGIAIPLINNQINASNGSVIDWAKSLVSYLQGLSPKLQHGSLFILLSGIFQALDPSLTDVEANTAAQLVYAKSTLQK